VVLGRDRDVGDAAGAGKASAACAETESAVEREGGGWEVDLVGETAASAGCFDSRGRHVETSR
jgi:hypothetical protein